MMKILLITGLLLFPLQVYSQSICADKTESILRACLQEKHQPKESLGYDRAREEMFTRIDNINGRVQLVYSGRHFSTKEVPDHTEVNTEHTWPRAHFQGKDIEADLHHLFPTYSRINSKRGALPFAEIPDSSTDEWLISNEKGLSKPSPNVDMRDYSEWASRSFEPRDYHKGALARALFYIYGVYPHDQLDMKWFKGQVDTLRQWHKEYPVTDRERTRSKAISRVQGNENPFILDPGLVDRLFPEPTSVASVDPGPEE